MSSVKESIKNDITTTHGDTTDVETESQGISKAGKDGGCCSMKKLIILGVAAVVSVAAVALILYLTLPSSSESELPTAQALIGNNTTTSVAPPASSTEVSDIKKLIFVQVLFRHGARAPRFRKKFEKYRKVFPRGEGQLTDRGFNHSHLVGLFLKKRYVDSGFLNKTLVNHEMKWFSRQMSRLLSTASTIGSAMFRTPEQKYKTVEVVSRDHDDLLLKSSIHNCKASRNIIKNKCPGLLNKTLNSEREAWKCLNPKPRIFKKFNIKDSDTVINMHRNNVTLPDEILKRYKEISAGYLAVRDFKNGIGDTKWIQIRFGLLVNKLLKDMKKAWETHLSNNTRRKFNAYSTQDWVMGGVLDSFSVLKYIQSITPKEEPNYNVLILMELWERNGEPFVKFFYKPEEITDVDHKLLDLTSRVPGCQGQDECPLEVFNKCCDSTRLDYYTLYRKCGRKISKKDAEDFANLHGF